MNQTQTALGIIQAVAEAIRELGSVPSGELYAQLMGNLTLEQYNQIIAVLVRSGVVKLSGHVLTWNGSRVS